MMLNGPKFCRKNYFSLGQGISQNLDLFFFSAIARSEFSWPFAFVFLGPLLPISFAFHNLSGCHETLGVNYGQSLEMGLVNYRYNGPFYHHFCIKTDNVFQCAMSECR